MWEKDREDALRVATKLEIPLLTWDLSDEYEKKVTQYMIKGYKSGITPNPDVMCNKHIKFGAFLNKALKNGADYIATGHYARIKKTKNGFQLLKGLDKNKDQSYFLYTLRQKELSHTLFPIGEYTKPEIRKLAKKFGLPNWNKKDSQGVCFIGDLKMNEFLKNYIKPKSGKIIKISDKKVMGSHDGNYYYTIGQRHGLNIQGNGKTYFVSGKDMKKNIIFVDTLEKESKLFRNTARLKEISWTNTQPKLLFKAKIKTRYRQPDQEAIIQARGIIKFLKPQKALTPGQSAVIYQKDIVLGGGVII